MVMYVSEVTAHDHPNGMDSHENKNAPPNLSNQPSSHPPIIQESIRATTTHLPNDFVKARQRATMPVFHK